MRIGILTPGHPPEELARVHGDYDGMFRTLLDAQGFEFETWDVERMAFPPGPDVADAWLVGGSRHGAYEDHPFIPPLEAFLREAWAARRRIVGICFGHQILAQALGGRVEKAAGWSVGPTDYALTRGGRLKLNAWHQDRVARLPDLPASEGRVEVIGRSAACPHAMLLYPGRALTMQPHPEFAPAFLRDLVRLRRGTGTYPDDRMEAALADAPLDRAAIARTIGAFLRTGAPEGLLAERAHAR
jgi:GMP synthase (glutamine-hydrolysing)